MWALWENLQSDLPSLFTYNMALGGAVLCTYQCCPLQFYTHLLLNEDDTAKWVDKAINGLLCDNVAFLNWISFYRLMMEFFLCVESIIDSISKNTNKPFFLMIALHESEIWIPPKSNQWNPQKVTIGRTSRAQFLTSNLFLGQVYRPIFYPLKRRSTVT